MVLIVSLAACAANPAEKESRPGEPHPAVSQTASVPNKTDEAPPCTSLSAVVSSPQDSVLHPKSEKKASREDSPFAGVRMTCVTLMTKKDGDLFAEETAERKKVKAPAQIQKIQFILTGTLWTPYPDEACWVKCWRRCLLGAC